MVLIAAKHFLALTRLEKYETLRDLGGKLVVLDKLSDVFAFKNKNSIAFFSHQWLGWGMPDPNDVHIKAMQSAVKTIEAQMDQNKTLYVWVDYTSIAQNHVGMQQAAVGSLPVYASVADQFVIIAPKTIHCDSNRQCDLDTYQARGWCRAEMLSKVCGSGVSGMTIAELDEAGTTTLKPITMDDIAKLSLYVFEGNFTVPQDAEQLVDPVVCI